MGVILPPGGIWQSLETFRLSQLGRGVLLALGGGGRE